MNSANIAKVFARMVEEYVQTNLFKQCSMQVKMMHIVRGQHAFALEGQVCSGQMQSSRKQSS